MTIRAIRQAIQEIPKDPNRRDLSKVEDLVQACFASQDYKEGRTAFMEKRRPAFRGALVKDDLDPEVPHMR